MMRVRDNVQNVHHTGLGARRALIGDDMAADPAPMSNRKTDFYALWLKRRVYAQGGAFWGLERWMITFGRNMHSKHPNVGGNRHCNFKPKRRNIKIAISQKPYKFDQDQI